MRIGFDAKRAFQNSTGLGHYSRTLLRSLAHDYPMHEYFLFAPKATSRFDVASTDFKTVTPQSFPYNLLKSAWRSRGMLQDLLKNKIDLY
ncbi:MAG: glycosyltransferase family 1 protein, partial [Sphingobacteriales bacterium]